MKTKGTFAIALILLIACKNSHKQKLSVKAINDSGVALTNHYQDTSKFKQAIGLLNQAVKIDSSYYDTYCKKLFFEIALGEFENASRTSTKLIRFKPDSADLYFQRGVFKELSHDSLSSKPDFAKAVLLYKLTLDTMNRKSPYWFADWKSSAVCLIMTGQEQIIRDYLKQNCTNAFDSSIYNVEVLTKSKEELLQTMRSRYIR